MKKLDLIFIIDTNIGGLAVAEAKKLGIPIIAVWIPTLIQQELIFQYQAMMMRADRSIFIVNYLKIQSKMLKNL